MTKKMLMPIVAAVIVLLGMCSLFVANSSLTATVHSDGRTIDVLASNNDALRDQVKSLGETPVAPPADSVTSSPEGQKGGTGTPGRAPTSAEIFAQVKTYCQFSFCVGPQGSTGAAGQNGTDGTPGQNGADGQSITGPAGPAGTSGTDGQPPASWTYTDTFGVTSTCARTDPFDPAAPTYSCAPTEGATP